MRIRLTVGEASATARLYDNDTARDFASLLPVTITVHDLGGREKAGALPRELTGGCGQSEYRAGQLGYWPPSKDLALYYHEDGFRIPGPGIVMIGEIESGLDAITVASDNDTLTITVADD
ncbi:MAG: cyclophilin-like fold protein [Pseudonocardiaceae bacterium]